MHPRAAKWRRWRDGEKDSENRLFYNVYLAENGGENTISCGRFSRPAGYVVVPGFFQI